MNEIISEIERVVHTCESCAYRDEYNCVKYGERVHPSNLACLAWVYGSSQHDYEPEVMKLISQGYSYRQVARELNLSHSKVFRIADKNRHYQMNNLRLKKCK